MKYRAEIDGLRALAVAPVILFHAGSDLFSGGFVGVDVFFVISGYLITTIILDDMEKGAFSLARFYERRARRILPALFLVAFVSTPFAVMLMMPGDLEDYSASLIAVATFSANILFWQESGYFGLEAELQPFLHAWSLAVEEQYYILFPLFLIAMRRFARRTVLLSMAALFIASLGLAQWGAYHAPTAAFFLLPTRIWELLVGVFCAYYLKSRTVRADARAQVLSGAGLVLILGAVFAFDETTPTPSLYTLAPTLGAALLIVFAAPNTVAHYLLSRKPLVGVGLISYSAYLWHQPVFAFARHAELSDRLVLTNSLYAVLIALSFALAVLSWRYVEQPFRGKRFPTRRVVVSSCAAAGALLFAGAAGRATDGFEHLLVQYRLSPETRAIYRVIADNIEYDLENDMHANGDCHVWVKNAASLSPDMLDACFGEYGAGVIVLGDSHAMNLYNMVAKSGAFDFVVGVSQGGCRPHDNHAFCHYDGFDVFLEKNGAVFSDIIFHQSGSYFVEDVDGRVDSQLAFEGGFGKFNHDNIETVRGYLKALQSNFEGGVVWLGPFIEYRRNPKKAFFRPSLMQVNPASVEIFTALENVLASYAGEPGAVRYVGFEDIFSTPLNTIEGDCFIFKDADHFSKCGEALLGARSKENLRKLREAPAAYKG